MEVSSAMVVVVAETVAVEMAGARDAEVVWLGSTTRHEQSRSRTSSPSTSKLSQEGFVAIERQVPLIVHKCVRDLTSVSRVSF
jgi:hypothetical protein